MRLLWVENHAVFARMAGRQFLVGHDLTVVPTLAAARDMLANHHFDALLLDHDLDDGKGVALLPFVRRLPERLAVVATSAHADGNAALLAAGADVACAKTEFARIGEVLAWCQAVVARSESHESDSPPDRLHRPG